MDLLSIEGMEDVRMREVLPSFLCCTMGAERPVKAVSLCSIVFAGIFP